MFQIFMAVGWTAVMIILLYIWADIREILGLVKESKREMLRSSFGSRNDISYPDLRDGKGKTAAEQKESAPEEGEADSETLKASEEQILKEVLAEFLG